METMETTTTVRDLLDVFQESQRKGESAKLFLETRNGICFVNFSAHLPAEPSPGKESGRKVKSPSSQRRDKARLQAWKLKKSSTAIHQPVQNNSFMESDNDEDCEKKTDTKTKVIKDSIEITKDLEIVLEENFENKHAESPAKIMDDKSSEKLKEEDEEEDDWEPPEFLNCIKFFMDDFENANSAEEKIRQILIDNNVTIIRLQVLHNSHKDFRKLFGLEIEDCKHDALEKLKESIRKDYHGVHLEMKYNRTLENIDNFYTN